MDRRLLEPRWLLAHLVVAGLAVLFVFLGFWQLDRHEQRQEENEVGERRIGAETRPLEALLSSSEGLEELRYRRVEVTGRYQQANEVLIRSRVRQGTAGFHVITPLAMASGDVVLVNRGWVPLNVDQVPVEEAPPPAGRVTVTGWVDTTQERPPLGAEHPPEGRLQILNRVDIPRIAQQIQSPVAPVYLVRTDQSETELPLPVEPPQFNDQGPHLGYAVQWFGFAAVGLVGYFFLARKRLRSSA